MRLRHKSARSDAIKLAKEIVELSGDDETLAAALRFRDRLKLPPMSAILNKVPGLTVKDRARSIGVSRQTYYGWLNGRSRPNSKQARRLQELTDIPFTKIALKTGLKGHSHERRRHESTSARGG